MGVRVPPFAPTRVRDPSASLRIAAAGSDARKTPRLRIWRGNPWGFESPLSHHEGLFLVAPSINGLDRRHHAPSGCTAERAVCPPLLHKLCPNCNDGWFLSGLDVSGGVRQVLLGDNVVAVQDAAGLVAAHGHGQELRNTAPHHVVHCRTARFMAFAAAPRLVSQRECAQALGRASAKFCATSKATNNVGAQEWEALQG
jgi:hypothetical protein